MMLLAEQQRGTTDSRTVHIIARSIHIALYWYRARSFSPCDFSAPNVMRAKHALFFSSVASIELTSAARADDLLPGTFERS